MSHTNRRKTRKSATTLLSLTQLESRETPAVSLVSQANPNFNPLGNGDSETYAFGANTRPFSADGRFQVFESEATNLVAGDTNGQRDIFLRDRQTGAVERVNLANDGSQATGGTSRTPSISADGRFVVFDSAATNLVTGDTNARSDIFVRDRMLGTTTRISVDTGGNQATGGNSLNASMSSDGRFVAFQSAATNLVANDTNIAPDVFVRDTKLGTTTRVSVDSAGNQAIGDSFSASISSDGRFVVFDSAATNLVANDTSGFTDIFVRDTMQATTTLISVDSAGNQANDTALIASISSDGRFVAFESRATNLVTGDTNNVFDIFVRDRMLGTTTRVSVDTGGNQANDTSADTSISSDGRFIAFRSSATNLVTGDTNGQNDIFVRDTMLATTTRVSVDSAGNQAFGDSTRPSLSPDGRLVSFVSGASNLVPGDTNGFADVFVRDLTANTTEASSRTNFTGGTDHSFVVDTATPAPRVSSDGRFVVFESLASNLVVADTNGQRDIFLLDRQTGQIERVSVADDESQATGGDSGTATISADGRFVAFHSNATNLVAGDTNARRDIFVRDRMLGTTTRVSVDSAGAQATGGDSNEPTMSADGNLVVFDSSATNLVAGDTNGVSDIFIRDLAGNTTTRISRNTTGGDPNQGSNSPSISPNGRFVVYFSLATNLVANDTNNQGDTFLFDRMNNATEIISVDSAGVQGDGQSFEGSVSDDGRFVTFRSDASNLVPGDANVTSDVFLRDRQLAMTTAVSVTGTGITGNSSSFVPTMSGDGQFVVFQSNASNLVPGDGNASSDVFLRNLTTGTTTRLSVNASGVEGNFNSSTGTISRNGNFVAFSSFASNLVAGDANNRFDVFFDTLAVGGGGGGGGGSAPVTTPTPTPMTSPMSVTPNLVASTPGSTLNQQIVANLVSFFGTPNALFAFSTIVQVSDLNGDGALDVAALVGLKVKFRGRDAIRFFLLAFDGNTGGLLPGGFTRLGTVRV